MEDLHFSGTPAGGLVGDTMTFKKVFDSYVWVIERRLLRRN